VRSPQLASSMENALYHPTINPWLEDRRLGNLPPETGPSISSTSARAQTTSQPIPPPTGPEAPPRSERREPRVSPRCQRPLPQRMNCLKVHSNEGGNIEEEGLTTLTQMHEEQNEKRRRVKTVERQARIDTIR
jgi:hypothetical protein